MMCERRSYPMCTEKESNACFDMETKKVNPSKNGRRDETVPQKQYYEVRHWK